MELCLQKSKRKVSLGKHQIPARLDTTTGKWKRVCESFQWNDHLSRSFFSFRRGMSSGHSASKNTNLVFQQFAKCLNINNKGKFVIVHSLTSRV